jgi:hypothetical protein
MLSRENSLNLSANVFERHSKRELMITDDPENQDAPDSRGPHFR